METMPEGNMAHPPSWWSRNWKWATPAGCLALLSCGCLGFVLLGLGAAGAGVAALASAGPTVEAVQAAQSDPEVQRVLGTPLKAGLNRQVSINSVNGQTRAQLRIPLDGPKADGILDAEATKEGEAWTFQRLVVEVPGQQAPIDLLDTSGGSAPPTLAPDAPPPVPPAPPSEEQDTDLDL